jgi:hypothetical protein
MDYVLIQINMLAVINDEINKNTIKLIRMRSLFSKIFYLFSIGSIIFSFYNATLAVNSLFQKSSESDGPIFQESKQLIYVAAGSLFLAFILYLFGRKISKNQ